jgi:hypothetical protein
MLFVMRVLAPERVAGCTRTSLIFRIALHPDRRYDAVDSANTMSSALEVLGLSLPFSSSTPATYGGTFHDSSLFLRSRLTLPHDPQRN